jgi:predicted transcriptional regulator
MQLIIQLDAETARQLAEIQEQTNQDPILVIQQGIGLYYQQLQPHRQFYIETKRHYELVGNVSVNTSSN